MAASAEGMNTALSIRALFKFLPLAAPAEDNQTAWTDMDLGGILEQSGAVHASLLTDTTDDASAAGLTRATSRRLGGLGPRLLPHDCQAGDADQGIKRIAEGESLADGLF